MADLEEADPLLSSGNSGPTSRDARGKIALLAFALGAVACSGKVGAAIALLSDKTDKTTEFWAPLLPLDSITYHRGYKYIDEHPDDVRQCCAVFDDSFKDDHDGNNYKGNKGYGPCLKTPCTVGENWENGRKSGDKGCNADQLRACADVACKSQSKDMWKNHYFYWKRDYYEKKHWWNSNSIDYIHVVRPCAVFE